MTLNAYSNRFRSAKRSNRAISWNTWDSLMALFQSCMYCNETKITWRPQWKIPLENLWTHHFRDCYSKCPQMPRPSRTCAFSASSKAAYYSLSAYYLKTFWQPYILINIFPIQDQDGFWSQQLVNYMCIVQKAKQISTATLLWSYSLTHPKANQYCCKQLETFHFRRNLETIFIIGGKESWEEKWRETL